MGEVRVKKAKIYMQTYKSYSPEIGQVCHLRASVRAVTYICRAEKVWCH